MATSFKKKSTTRGRPNLPVGTKPSLNNNQLLISTGIPSLDVLIGGGLAVGTLLLVEEDAHSSYSNILQKLFIAEGAACKQSLFLASADKNPEFVLQDIPCNTNNECRKETSEHKSDLKIAWRYQNQTKHQSPIVSTSQFGHYFDLSQTLSEEKIKEINYSFYNPNDYVDSSCSQPINPSYKELFNSIKLKIENENLYTSNLKTISILRINISSLGSPLWNESLITAEIYDPSLAWFLLALRSLLRNSYAACLITMPTYLFEEPVYVDRLEHCCDTVIKLESFAGSEKAHNPLYKEYHGLFHVRKIAHLNCIAAQNIDTADMAFKLKRKRFVIEKLHLPPDISETVSRSQGNTIKLGTPLCGVTTPVNNLLDF